VKVVSVWRFVDGKGLMSRPSRRNRHNRHHLPQKCHKLFNPTSGARGLTRGGISPRLFAVR
jgi:hypothetical protein